MTNEQIRELVKKIEQKVKEFEQAPETEIYGLNSYDAVEFVLREELKDFVR